MTESRPTCRAWCFYAQQGNGGGTRAVNIGNREPCCAVVFKTSVFCWVHTQVYTKYGEGGLQHGTRPK